MAGVATRRKTRPQLDSFLAGSPLHPRLRGPRMHAENRTIAMHTRMWLCVATTNPAVRPNHICEYRYRLILTWAAISPVTRLSMALGKISCLAKRALSLIEFCCGVSTALETGILMATTFHAASWGGHDPINWAHRQALGMTLQRSAQCA